MPKMRLKPDQMRTSCLACGVAAHPKATRGPSGGEALSKDSLDLGQFRGPATTHLPYPWASSRITRCLNFPQSNSVSDKERRGF